MLASAIRKTPQLPPWPAIVCYLIATGVLAVGYVFDQSTCLWRATTGLPCPGCGMIHALLALGAGDLRSAWAFNPGSFVAVPILLWTALGRVKELC